MLVYQKLQFIRIDGILNVKHLENICRRYETVCRRFELLRFRNRGRFETANVKNCRHLVIDP